MNNFVTIKSFASSVDFEMVKSYLASCGIECFGRDEITNRAYLNGVNGGVKLQVSEDKVEEAINLLLEGGYITKEDLEPASEIKWLDNILSKFRSNKND
jgi:hypothetical protein